MATDDLPELRAYKLGKRRWSYNQCELVLHQDDDCGPGVILAAAGAVYKKESDLEELCTDPESQVEYQVHLDNGAVVMVVLYLVYAEPSNACCQTDVLPQQRSQADMHDGYQWNLVKRSACSKGCQGPLLHTVRRQSGKDLLGSACSQPIRVMANNDIPHGAAHIPLVVNVRKDWVGRDTKSGLVSRQESLGAPVTEQAEQLYGDTGLTVDQPASPGFTGVAVRESTAFSGLHGQQQDELPADLLNVLSQFDQRQLLGTNDFNCSEDMAFALPPSANGISGETSYVQLLDDFDSSGGLDVPEGCFVSSNCCMLRRPSSPAVMKTTCDDADGGWHEQYQYLPQIRLPDGWEWDSPWEVELSPYVDKEGWAYAPDWAAMDWPPQNGAQKRGVVDFTRRRRWLRRRRQDLTRPSPPPQEAPAPSPRQSPAARRTTSIRAIAAENKSRQTACCAAGAGR
ncbi:hypothetical protein WJX82_007077 [Trebouxia sp. C0006]